MSELSELIEIARNIERQNDEIIRLLKKIADGSEAEKPEDDSVINLTPDFGDLILSYKDALEDEDSTEDFELDESFRIGSLLDNEIDVGEVYFIEGTDIFKLSINNNETTVDNITGDGEPTSFALQELIANESIKNNESLRDGTVILGSEHCQNLPEVMKICVEQGAQMVYIPLFASAQLVGSPHNLINYVRMDFFKNDDHLIEKLF
ncbi:hypothetical protein [Methanobrevibacter sp.]|uniref:hypothetical protein n=1 Tax=Methanobrevibacter sp. TaxID=66852 RepID=UPI003863282C